jgi:hypothetical protein
MEVIRASGDKQGREVSNLPAGFEVWEADMSDIAEVWLDTDYDGGCPSDGDCYRTARQIAG